MASVCLALLSGKAGFQKLVALKRPGSDLAHEPEHLAMFLDEARLAARLNHPNVVHTYEVGQRNGQPFIAMEFVDGQPLSRIRRLPALPLALHLSIIADVLLGLHHAHELRDFDGTSLQVVHRDVSPQNVLVSYDGAAKLVDFGIAKAQTQLSQTLAGYVKGKIAYMSPEQIIGESLDRRTDLFAVGVLLWEASARRRLWPGIPARERIRLLEAGDVPSLTELDPQLPPALDAICRRALAFLPARRYQSAAEIEAELQALLAPGSVLHATRRDVAAFMAEQFQPQRAETRRLIETKLGHLGIESHSRSPLRLGSDTLLESSVSSSVASNTDSPTLVSQNVESVARALPDMAASSEAAAAPVSIPPPSVGAPSVSGGGPRRTSIYSWGRSAPPPVPPVSTPRKPLAAFSFAALSAAALTILVATGGVFLVQHAVSQPSARPAAFTQPQQQEEQQPAPVASPAAPPQPLAPAMVEQPAPTPPVSAQPPRTRKRLAPQARPLASTREPAPSDVSNDSVVGVTDFGGRR
jgi:serine/threonine protein kinase